MSLRLRQAIAGRPTSQSQQNFDVLTVAGLGFIAYPSDSKVILLDHEFELADTLSFWDALPHRPSGSKSREVEGVSCSSSSGLILAWSDLHIVIWEYQQTKGRARWALHSTISASAPVTCLDYHIGTLVLGTCNGLELWRTDPSSEVVVWDLVWDRSYPEPTSVSISPSCGHVAWHQEAKSVYILSIDRKGGALGMPQELRHPRDVSWIGWRKPISDTGDAHIYTITSNSVLRIYSPVLDDPSWFQLLSSMDSRSFAKPRGSAKGKVAATSAGTLWVLDADHLRSGLAAQIFRVEESGERVPAESMKIMEALAAEESDVVAWLGSDGVLSLRSIVNMDRRPPTLLKSLPLASSPFAGTRQPYPPWTSESRLLHTPTSSVLLAVFRPTPAMPTICGMRISLIDLLSSRPTGLIPSPVATSGDTTRLVQMTHPIDHFVRTPNGRALLAVGEAGEMAIWSKEKLGKVSKGQPGPEALLDEAQWMETRRPAQTAIFAKGRAVVSCCEGERGEAEVVLRHLDGDSPAPSEGVALPSFSPEPGDDVKMLLAVSDVDDGFSGRRRKSQRAIIIAASKAGQAWVWRITWRMDSSTTDNISVTEHQPEISLLSQHQLPVEGHKPHLVLQVDPMGWHQSVIDWKTDTPLQDMILTVSREGVLEFWTPQLGHHFAFERTKDGLADTIEGFKPGALHDHSPWSRSGLVRTGRANPLMARCSSRKKTVLVCEKPDGSHEMSIWDSNISEFSTGLELVQTFEQGEKIQDLDWTTTSDLQSILAVGFPHKVVLVCEQRMSYVETTPGWAPFLTINLEMYTSVRINDSIWLAGGSLVVGAGNQIYLFGRFLDRDTPVPSPPACAKGVQLDSDEPEDIFQLVAQQNGPLWDYHPTLLAQCLLWDKIHLVKSILLDIVKGLRKSEENGRKRLAWTRLDSSDFYSTRGTKPVGKVLSRRYDSLFDAAQADACEDEGDLTSNHVTDLVEYLDGSVILPLSQAEKSMLATIAQATVEVERQRRSLDLCGLRYLISIRIFVNQNRRSGASGVATPASGAQPLGGIMAHRTRLSFRNIVWAMHSESQDVLLSAATDCCINGKMLWSDAKRLGVLVWLRSSEIIRSQLEVIARNRFMADEDRDPTSCSLIFFALGKKKVVHGLWRQAPGHQEQQLMLKFLANDFEQDRWKTAAMKNAYALLAKQRYEYAAAFFMLAASPKDAINICIRQLDDWQLAVALARAVEGGTDGPLLKSILSGTVVPLAFAGGHRWLATWAFWLLGRRDLAVRVLMSPMRDIADDWSPDRSLDVGNSENDDPSLLLLFQHLKSKSMQTAKGTSEIPGKLEFDFVLHNARVFFRMGCHPLALDLLRSWSFERPFFPPSKLKTRVTSPAPDSSPTSSKSPTRPSIHGTVRPSPTRPFFLLASSYGRRESMYMDMDVLVESEPPSRAPSPSPAPDGHPASNGSAIEEEEEPPKKPGNLMKEMKQDVQQGAAEFKMDNFF